MLAKQLSDDPGTSVLIVEGRGSEDDNPMISVPFAAPIPQTSEQDWAFRTPPPPEEGVTRIQKQCEN